MPDNSRDISEKILEDHNDVFADIVNNLVFDGQEILREEELESVRTVSDLKMEDGLHEQERDTAKRWRRGTIVLAAWGLENQTKSDPTMPLRVIGYDGATYKAQANHYHSARRRRQTPEPFYPSITIVLYFGTTHWSGPKTLRDCFRNVPREIEPFVPDYPIHVIEAAFLTPEQIGRLKSDFRHVAGYLAQARTNGAYIPADGQILHVDETLKLMEAITGDSRFRETMNEIALERKERVTMYNVIDSYIAKGREEARREYETALAEKERAMYNVIDSYIAKGREEARREYETALAERDHTIQEKDHAIQEKDRAMNAMARELRDLKLRYGLV